MTEHQFGGSHLDRYVFDFETTVDAVEAAPAEAAPTDTVVEPAAEITTPEATPATVADPFADLGIDPADLRELAELAPVLRNVLAQPTTAPAEPAAAPPQLDPFAEDFGEQLLNLMRSVVGEAVQPLTAHTEAQQHAEQQSLLRDAAHDTEQRLGEFLNGDTSRELMLAHARQVFPEVVQRYGMTDRAADMALERAHQHVAQMEKAIGDAAVARYQNSLSTLSNAPTEPGSETTAVVRTPSGFRDEVEMARRWGS